MIEYFEKYKSPELDKQDSHPGEKSNHKITHHHKPINSLVVPDNTIPLWKADLETPTKLRTTDFDRPGRNHSVTQEACGETISFFLIKSGYLDKQSVHVLYETHLLVPHMARMMDTLSHYDF